MLKPALAFFLPETFVKPPVTAGVKDSSHFQHQAEYCLPGPLAHSEPTVAPTVKPSLLNDVKVP